MKLLKSESEFFLWISGTDGWRDVRLPVARNFGPTAYPCYGYWDGEKYNDYLGRYDPSFLYLADASLMLDDLRKAGA